MYVLSISSLSEVKMVLKDLYLYLIIFFIIYPTSIPFVCIIRIFESFLLVTIYEYSCVIYSAFSMKLNLKKYCYDYLHVCNYFCQITTKINEKVFNFYLLQFKIIIPKVLFEISKFLKGKCANFAYQYDNQTFFLFSNLLLLIILIIQKYQEKRTTKNFLFNFVLSTVLLFFHFCFLNKLFKPAQNARCCECRFWENFDNHPKTKWFQHFLCSPYVHVYLVKTKYFLKKWFPQNLKLIQSANIFFIKLNNYESLQ